jgi:hypothetical protein
MNRQSNDMNMILVVCDLHRANNASLDLGDASRSLFGAFGLANRGLGGRSIDGSEWRKRRLGNSGHVGSVIDPRLADRGLCRVLSHESTTVANIHL